MRSVDPERLIFFDGVTWGDLGAGFDAAPAENNTVLGFHYYAPPQLEPEGGHANLQFKAQSRIAKKVSSSKERGDELKEGASLLGRTS